MSGFLDANILIRYFTNEPPHLADRAAQIIDHTDDLWVTDVALIEAAFVLTRFYQVSRQMTVDHLVAFVQKANISVYGMDKGLVLQALLLCRPSGRVSFADAMVWAAAHQSGKGVVYSLDARFPKDGIELRDR